jgi:signal transduction histidine kinase
MPPTAREIAIPELIVHELRTPLAVASGSLAQLAEAAAFTASQQPAADRVARALNNAGQLVEQLRGWSRTSAASALSRVQLGPLLERAVTRCDAGRRGITVTTTAAHGVEVMAAPDSVEGALASLVGAVVRSAPSKSTVPLNVTVLDSVVHIAIGDLGDSPPAAGFAAEFVGGLGFTLPVARATLESVGGRVWSNTPDGRVAGTGVELRRP